MHKTTRGFFVFGVFLLLSSIVYGQDYSIYSGKFYDLKQGEEKIEFEHYNGTYNICEDENKAVPILIENNGAKTGNIYDFDAAGAVWASLSAKEFSLAENKRGVAFLELNPGKNSSGKYSVRINALSSIGHINRNLVLDVNVEKCHSVRLELEKEEDRVCGGIKQRYTGRIINDGREKIDAALNIAGPNWISAYNGTFSVAPHEDKKFELNADVPANAKGVFNAAVSAAITSFPPVKSEKMLRLDVVQKYDCYRPDLASSARIASDYSRTYAPIKIKNSGIKQASYEIGLNAPSWISIEPKKITVNPQQFGNLNLDINPNPGIEEGTYAVRVDFKFNDILYSKNIDVALSKKQSSSGLKSFLAFYQHYIYLALLITAILFAFRLKAPAKIKAKYKNYRIRQLRLRALEAARKSREEKAKKAKKEVQEGEIHEAKGNRGFFSEPEPKESNAKHGKVYFLIGLTALALFLFFSIYKFDIPISKEFASRYYAYFIAGILASLFIIFLIEFYRPLANLLGKLNRKR